MLEFCLQRVILLLVVHIRFYSFFFVCSVQEMTFSTCYLCLQGIFLFAVFSLCESGVPLGHRIKQTKLLGQRVEFVLVFVTKDIFIDYSTTLQ